MAEKWPVEEVREGVAAVVFPGGAHYQTSDKLAHRIAALPVLLEALRYYANRDQWKGVYLESYESGWVVAQKALEAAGEGT